jgi:MinD-like ATPase involved in chromosome partitioning or flagellar assembly
MYVVTFYSFKGGVGRTMSLVNVAAELAKKGRRILMVDFDLEAPGLSDFELIAPNAKTPGLVEFVTEYITTNSVPRIEKYVYQSTKYPETEDRLWIMPAGCQNGDYQSLFSSINWQDLYADQNGYLLMEDLRAQWSSFLAPDYVFIDSRTGYTDIAGICTRQLPDAVCLIFTPNKQNLTGLTRITAEIKAQIGEPGLRQPRLHFVASNIPSLEDDEDVLKKALGNFSRQLEYVNPTAVIHHYNSFSLINEAVFTMEYPKNPLANEYRLLADAIAKGNLGDRSTAIEYLQSVIKQSSDRTEVFSVTETDERLVTFEREFSSDPEVLFWMSRARRALGSLEEAETLLDAAIENGLNTPRGFLDRAILRFNQQDQDNDAIWSDLRHVLSMSGGVQPSELLWTLKLSSRLGQGTSDEVLTAPAILGLPSGDLLYLVDKMHDSRANVLLAVKILSHAIARGQIENARHDEALQLLGIKLIAVGELQKAVDAFASTRAIKSDVVELTSTFNYAMAKYWNNDDAAVELFFKVVRILSIEVAAVNANFLQCLSFAHFALGDTEKALVVLEMAKEKIGEQSGLIFSCWRYLEVSPNRFKEDLMEMRELYLGQEISPVFVRSTHKLL